MSPHIAKSGQVQRTVPKIEKVQKIIEVPEIQVIEKIVEVPEIQEVLRQVPATAAPDDCFAQASASRAMDT